ncbi:HAMP domain-containing sensor histidine kinase [Thalassotalea ponticola]|uniref:sensor histidine kinase n=1 Tax=Thalassotalea ponticola TaxID=1523392 RepID=UPI0025B578D0|nr:HAMP domain-containing sensor histidine kinase [Thalassotalea ponticola]MDN3651910.1 HAMP domain-containing sensor histidine kinase [Thalassotalea ponticola]
MFSNQIRTRILVYFITSATLISLLFSGLSLLFSYHVEDSLFYKLLNNEMSQVQQQLNKGLSPSPSLSFVKYYQSTEQLPISVQTLLNEEPERIEFPGQNQKHYHLKKLPEGFLLAEVSDYLVVRSIKGSMAKTQLVFLLVIGVIVALMSWSLAKRIVKPMDKLVSILSKVQEQELPKGFSKDFANDEIGFFAKKLDQAMVRISQFIERERHFTRDVSHELRTPIAINQGALTLLKATELTKEQSILAKRLTDAQIQMQQCIDGLLALAREESFQYDDIAILPIIEQCILEHHKAIEGKDIELDLDIEPNENVFGSKLAMQIVIGNLISNAFQHTEQGVIRIQYQSGKLTIKDSGEGIAPELLSNVYQSGSKGESSTGFGIGLSLVKRLCEKTNMKVDISSDQQGTEICLLWLKAPAISV